MAWRVVAPKLLLLLVMFPLLCSQISIQSTGDLHTLGKRNLLLSSAAMLPWSFLVSNSYYHTEYMGSQPTLGTLSDSHLEPCMPQFPGPSSSLSPAPKRTLSLVKVLWSPFLYCALQKKHRGYHISVRDTHWVSDLPVGSIVPSGFLPLATPLSPSYTRTCTCSWLSETAMEVCVCWKWQGCASWRQASLPQKVQHQMKELWLPRPRNSKHFLSRLKIINEKTKTKKSVRSEHHRCQWNPEDCKYLLQQPLFHQIRKTKRTT